MNWYALYTKPRKEDAVAVRLQDAQIEVLTPKLKSKRYKGNKLIETVVALFPCYLLAKFDKDKCSHLISYTRGVRYIVGKNNPIVIHEEIVSAIKERMNEGNIVINTQNFERGDRVLIRDGPFKNFYGIFEREIRGAERVLIFLNTINYRVELDSWLLKKI